MAYKLGRQRRTPAASALMREKAVALRVAGLTYPAIAAQLGIDALNVYKLVSGAIDDVNKTMLESAAKLRDIEQQRLDGILEKLWPRRSDPRVADTILKVMERRAKFLGLDKPNKTNVNLTGLEGLSDEELIKRVEAITRAAAARGDDLPSDGDAKKE